MKSALSPPNGIPPILSELIKNDFALGRKLSPFLNDSLGRYIKSVIPSPIKVKNRYYRLLVNAMESYLEKYKDPVLETVESLLDQSPIIQQADHSNLLLDQEVFLNNILHALGANLQGVTHIFTSQCSTVSCLSRRSPPAGPTFLRMGAAMYSLFDVSNRLLKDGNFCTLPSPAIFNITPTSDTTANDMNICLQHLNKMTFPSAEAAFRYANDFIWNQMGYPKDVRRISFDESMVSELAALHIESEDSPLFRLIFDRDIRNNFLRIKRDYINSPKNKAINLSYPDFFWLRKKGKLRALTCDYLSGEGVYVIAETGEGIDFDITPETISEYLRKGNVYMDRMMTYFVRCLLPNVVALGGTSQQDYLEEYQDIFLETHAATPFLDETCIDHFKNRAISQFGGAPLIYQNDYSFIEKLFKDPDLSEYLNKMSGKPLIETIGNFSAASYLLDNYQYKCV